MKIILLAIAEDRRSIKALMGQLGGASIGDKRRLKSSVRMAAAAQ